jgi:hypothetical protein
MGQSGQSKSRIVIIICTALILVTLAGWAMFEYFQPYKPRPLVVGAAGQSMSGTNAQFSDIKAPVSIFYPTSQGLIREDKTVAGGSLPVKMVESLLQEYFNGFKTEMKNTVVRGVYRDRNRVFYIDLSEEFRRNFSGDAAYEYYLLKSLYQTVVMNVAEVKDIKILIEGREVESLGGHMIILNSLQEIVSF